MISVSYLFELDTSNFTREEKRQYREGARKFHPDFNGGKDEEMKKHNSRWEQFAHAKKSGYNKSFDDYAAEQKAKKQQSSGSQQQSSGTNQPGSQQQKTNTSYGHTYNKGQDSGTNQSGSQKNTNSQSSNSKQNTGTTNQKQSTNQQSSAGINQSSSQQKTSSKQFYPGFKNSIFSQIRRK